LRIRPLKQEERARGYTEVATKVDDKVKTGPGDTQEWPPKCIMSRGEGQKILTGGHQGG